MTSLARSLWETDYARLVARCQSYEGAEAIHVERPGVFHVRISQICCDTWGVKAIATDLLTPGLQRPTVEEQPPGYIV